eukprot:ANDGO_05795.mRNA.1 Protein TIC 55
MSLLACLSVGLAYLVVPFPPGISLLWTSLVDGPGYFVFSYLFHVLVLAIAIRTGFPHAKQLLMAGVVVTGAKQPSVDQWKIDSQKEKFVDWPVNVWYPVLVSTGVPRDKPVSIRRFGRELVVWKDENGVVVVQSARCPHKGASLGYGWLADIKVKRDGSDANACDARKCVVCPYHGLHMDSRGNCVYQPTEHLEPCLSHAHSLETFPSRDEYGLIWMFYAGPANLDYETLLERSANVRLPIDHAYRDAVDRTLVIPAKENSYFEGIDSPHTFMRIIENTMLDGAHQAVLHSNALFRTFCKQQSRFVETMKIQIKDDEVGIQTDFVFRQNASEEGSHSRSDVYYPSTGFLQFQNAKNINLLVALCPIDGDRCYFIGGIMQQLVVSKKVPWLGRFISWLIYRMEASIFIHEDDVAIGSQVPRHFGAKSDRFLKSDRASVLYHKWVAKNGSGATGIDLRW